MLTQYIVYIWHYYHRSPPSGTFFNWSANDSECIFHCKKKAKYLKPSVAIPNILELLFWKCISGFILLLAKRKFRFSCIIKWKLIFHTAWFGCARREVHIWTGIIIGSSSGYIGLSVYLDYFLVFIAIYIYISLKKSGNLKRCCPTCRFRKCQVSYIRTVITRLWLFPLKNI